MQGTVNYLKIRMHSYLYAYFSIMFERITHTILLLFTIILTQTACGQIPPEEENEVSTPLVITGAERMDQYLSILEGKRVGLLINQTSVVGDDIVLLPDTLLKRGVNIVKVFAPEHGFRGKVEAGEEVNDEVDSKTGLPIASLYGSSKKPSAAQMSDIDILVYDIQDVGARFYTYISTMQYAMEACAENGKDFLILDRPNPNGFYVDGPVLDKKLKSFVGMQPIPVVYGMTPGEYAKMLVGEKWFAGADKLNMKIIPCANYDHDTRYELPVNPSPNLRNMAAIYCYPSLCLFEGTDISVGRGTEMPFQQFGHPLLKDKAMYGFMPNIADHGPDPKHAAETCYGMVLATNAEEAEKTIGPHFRITYLLRAYNWFPEDQKSKFFINNNFFEKLAGNTELRKQVKDGWTEEQIRETWQEDLTAFKQIRKKYLLYKDFE